MKKTLKILLTLMLCFQLFSGVNAVQASNTYTFESSGVENNNENQFGAAKAFDGNMETHYSSANIKNSGSTTLTPQWLIVDLKENKRINNIAVHFFKKVFATAYTIETSSDKNEWTVVKTITNPTTTPDSPTNNIDFENAEVKRYLRFNFTAINPAARGNGVGINEIQIRLTSETPTAEAEFEYTSSGIENNDTQFAPEKAFDKNTSTRYSSGRMKEPGATASSSQTAQWLDVDLKEPKVLNKIKLHFYRKVFATEYTVETSENKQDWQVIALQTNLETIADNPVNTIAFNQKQTKRYLRFHFKKLNTRAAGHSVALTEIELDLQAVNATPLENTNIGLNKIYQSSGTESVGSEDVSAKRAFDNNTETRYSAARMRKDDGTFDTQWLEVDMLQRSTVNTINVKFYQKVHATEYEIKTSSDRTNWRTVRVERNEDEDTSNKINQITFATPEHFERFIRFEFKRLNTRAAGTSVSIREIEILGALEGEAINPNEKLTTATLEVENNQVVLRNIEEDSMFRYEIIGSSNQYVASHTGVLQPYRLTDKEVQFVVVAKDKATNEIFDGSKMNKSLLIPKTATYTKVEKAMPKIIPALQEFAPTEGQIDFANVTSVTRNEQLSKQIELFIQDVKTLSGKQLTIEDEGQITFNLETDQDTYALGKEGYFIHVNDKIHVTVKTIAAANYAAVTLTQIMMQQDHISKGMIRDYPSYEIRGMLLDAARMPMHIDFLKKVARLYRWYKLNEFHLDINNNQWPANGRKAEVHLDSWMKTGNIAHRLESKKFPSLTKQAFKTNTYDYEYDFYHNTYKNPVYSLEEYKAFQKELNDSGVNVLVEFDTPGHAAAYTVYAKNNPDNIDYLGDYINHPNDMELFAINETQHPERTARAKRFISELLSEYLEGDVFSYDHIHLGADEYWFKGGNHEAFRSYIKFLYELTTRNNKKLRTWGALNYFPGTTEVNKNIIFDEWSQAESDSLQRIREGYRVVNVPQPFTYVTPGRYHKDMINEQYVFDVWKPNMFNETAKTLLGEPNLLGAKGAIWGDEHREGIEENDLFVRLEKSLAMIGYKTWNPYETQSYLDYQKTFQTINPNKVNKAPSLVANVKTKANKVYSVGDQPIEITNHGVTTRDGWLVFDGDNYLETDLANIELPYTLEMTVNVKENTGTLLQSQYGELFLNKNGKHKDGDVVTGLGLSRYIYNQNISQPLTLDKEIKLTLLATQQVLQVYVNGEKVESLWRLDSDTDFTKNYRTSFKLPFKYIGKGFKGAIKDIKVYNRVLEENEFTNVNGFVNVALHKDVFDFRNNSRHNNQGIKPFHKHRITDGDVVSYEGYWQSTDQVNDYFIVDLGNAEQLSKVDVIFKEPVSNFDVAFSNDLVQFGNTQTINDNTKETVTIPTTVTARYVKFITKTPNVSVREMKVWKQFEDRSELDAFYKTQRVNLEDEAHRTFVRLFENKFTPKAVLMVEKENFVPTLDTTLLAEKITVAEEKVNSIIQNLAQYSKKTIQLYEEAKAELSALIIKLKATPIDTNEDLTVVLALMDATIQKFDETVNGLQLPEKQQIIENNVQVEFDEDTFTQPVTFDVVQLESVQDEDQFDLSFVANGEKVQPLKKVKVQLPIRKNRTVKAVLHYDEEIAFEVEGQSVIFMTDSFSPYKVVYTSKTVTPEKPPVVTPEKPPVVTPEKPPVVTPQQPKPVPPVVQPKQPNTIPPVNTSDTTKPLLYVILLGAALVVLRIAKKR